MGLARTHCITIDGGKSPLGGGGSGARGRGRVRVQSPCAGFSWLPRIRERGRAIDFDGIGVGGGVRERAREWERGVHTRGGAPRRWARPRGFYETLRDAGPVAPWTGNVVRRSPGVELWAGDDVDPKSPSRLSGHVNAFSRRVGGHQQERRRRRTARGAYGGGCGGRCAWMEAYESEPRACVDRSKSIWCSRRWSEEDSGDARGSEEARWRRGRKQGRGSVMGNF